MVLDSRMMQEVCEGSWHDLVLEVAHTCKISSTLVVIHRLHAGFEKKSAPQGKAQ